MGFKKKNSPIAKIEIKGGPLLLLLQKQKEPQASTVNTCAPPNRTTETEQRAQWWRSEAFPQTTQQRAARWPPEARHWRVTVSRPRRASSTSEELWGPWRRWSQSPVSTSNSHGPCPWKRARWQVSRHLHFPTILPPGKAAWEADRAHEPVYREAWQLRDRLVSPPTKESTEHLQSCRRY